MGKMYKDLKKGFEEIIGYKKGKIALKSEVIKIPKAPKVYDRRKIKKFRKSCSEVR